MPLPNNEKLLEQWERHREISRGDNGGQHKRAREAHAYNAGDEGYYTASVQDKAVRNSVAFNKIKPIVDAVVGFMIQLRRKPDYQARIMGEAEQEERSSYMNSLSDYIRSNANMASIESRQDREMLVTGYGAIDTNISYERNPDGEVASEVLRYNDVFWDPQSQEPNLLDARWVFRRKAFNLQEALKRFKGSKEEDFQSYTGDYDDGFVYNPGGGEYDKIASGDFQEEDLVEVWYYQWWELEKYYRAANPLYEMADPAQASILAQLMNAIKNNRMEVSTKEQVEDIFDFDPFAEFLVMTPVIRNDLRLLFERFGIELEEQEFLRKTYYTSILSGTTIFKKFKSPDQQGFTIKFKTANYDPVRRHWYGLVAGLIEPSRYANKALSQILYTIAANSKGGVMYEESAVDDTDRFEQQYATTKAAIRVNDGALSGGKIAPKAQAALPTGYEAIYEISTQSMEQTSGIGREFLGTSAASQVSALLESQRINQVIATLAPYFDAGDLYLKEQARLMTTFIRMLAENSEGRLVAIIGPQGATRYEALTQDRMVDEYDIEIGEAPTTPTQKAETAKIVIELADKMAQFGQNIYPTAIEYVPGMKQTDKQKIKAAIEPSEEEVAQRQQAAQQQAEAENSVRQSLMQVNEAKAMKDMADVELKQRQVDKTTAETVRTLEEASQKATENDVLRSRPVGTVNVTI